MDRRELLKGTLLSVTGAAIVSRSHALDAFLGGLNECVTGIWLELNRSEWRFFDSCGNILFPIYGASGSIIAQHMAWLIRRRDNAILAIRFTELELEATDANPEALKNLVRFKINAAMKRGLVNVDLDGGELPLLLDDES